MLTVRRAQLNQGNLKDCHGETPSVFHSSNFYHCLSCNCELGEGVGYLVWLQEEGREIFNHSKKFSIYNCLRSSILHPLSLPLICVPPCATHHLYFILEEWRDQFTHDKVKAIKNIQMEAQCWFYSNTRYIKDKIGSWKQSGPKSSQWYHLFFCIQELNSNFVYSKWSSFHAWMGKSVCRQIATFEYFRRRCWSSHAWVHLFTCYLYTLI